MVEIHPADAAANKLKDGDLAHLSTRYGFARAKVRVTDAQRPGQAFLPMHWSGHFAANAGAGAACLAGHRSILRPARTEACAAAHRARGDRLGGRADHAPRLAADRLRPLEPSTR